MNSSVTTEFDVNNTKKSSSNGKLHKTLTDIATLVTMFAVTATIQLLLTLSWVN